MQCETGQRNAQNDILLPYPETAQDNIVPHLHMQPTLTHTEFCCNLIYFKVNKFKNQTNFFTHLDGYAFSQEEGGAISQRDLIRLYTTG